MSLHLPFVAEDDEGPEPEELLEKGSEEAVKIPPRIEWKVTAPHLNVEITIWSDDSLEEVKRVAVELYQESLKGARRK